MATIHKSDIPPFAIYKNLYFVGSSKVSVHVIKTSVGLVMIDSGYPDMYEQILDSMQQMDLNPNKLCAIFHSHGHIDHFGCTLKFKELYDAKTYISRIDNDIVNGKLDLSWAKELNLEPLPYFNCDVLINDGDVFDFGNVSIRCNHTPGHTEGVMSFFIKIGEGAKSIVAAMHGGVGLNSMTADFLNAYGLSQNCREVFRKGLHDLAEEKVDLVLGNHPEQNNTVYKRWLVENGLSPLDKTEWKHFLMETENNLNALIEAEKQL